MHCGSVMKHPIHSEGSVGALHLTAEQLLDLVARGRRCPYYRQWLDHIALCATCRTTYKYLLRAEAARRAASRRFVPLQRLVPAVAMGLLAVVGLVLWLRWDWLAAPVKNAREGIIERRGGVLYEGRTRLPDWAADAVALLSTPPPVVRSGSTPASAIRLLEPDPANESIETLQPIFRWQPVSGAAGYFATLTHLPDGKVILLRVEGTRAVLPANLSLAPGSRYRLRIEARLPTGLPGSNPRGSMSSARSPPRSKRSCAGHASIGTTRPSPARWCSIGWATIGTRWRHCPISPPIKPGARRLPNKSPSACPLPTEDGSSESTLARRLESGTI
jgi:hypothetical protein